MIEVNKGLTAILPFKVRNDERALANADTLPTISQIMVNGVATTIAGTIVEQQQNSTPANITGRYQVRVPTSTLAVNSFVEVHLRATINNVVDDDDVEFMVISTVTGRPYIDTN